MAVLELSNISKHFGAIQAVNDVSLSLEAGEVVGLMGDNGAGKSTLVKMIAGNFPPSHGTMQHRRPRDGAAQAGRCAPPRHRDRPPGPGALQQSDRRRQRLPRPRAAHAASGRSSVLDYAAMYRRAGEIFTELKSETRPRDLVKQMSGGQRQAVAIARTMLSEAKIVLMDEPTAAISVRQVAEVLNLIRQLRDQGIAVVLISHRMPDVFAVADRVIVMRRGRKVADKQIANEFARRGHRPHHRRHRTGSVGAGTARRRWPSQPRPDDRAEAAQLDLRACSAARPSGCSSR